MMTDLEARLRRYRPVGPPADLRDRVVAASASAPMADGTWQWLLPLGAAAAIVLFSTLARDARRQAALDPSSDDRTRGSLVGVMTDALNGDVQLAKHIVAIEFVEEPIE
jgi:hypothetical protein